VQVDTAGHRVDLPRNTGRTWGPIWARSKESLIEMDGSDFWGDSALARREDTVLKEVVDRLKQAKNGLIGVHANVGITFDLQAMQLLHRNTPTEFRASVANIENSRDIPYVPKNSDRPLLASFHVVIDGQMRYERLDFGFEDGTEPFAVTLAPGDRFLTIISTDSGASDYYDHVILIDPVVSLEKTQ
jgi:hypothetical protein